MEDDRIESRYEPNRRGWKYSREVDDSELPAKQIEEVSDVKGKTLKYKFFPSRT